MEKQQKQIAAPGNLPIMASTEKSQKSRTDIRHFHLQNFLLQKLVSIFLSLILSEWVVM